MAEHNVLGKQGEKAATNFLINKGYEILDKNWHFGHLELDIIAKKNNIVSIVEVKTRATAEISQPEEAVTIGKIKRIVRAADAYVIQNKIEEEIRFDIITAVGFKNHFKISHIEDAFYPPLA